MYSAAVSTFLNLNVSSWITPLNVPFERENKVFANAQNYLKGHESPHNNGYQNICCFFTGVVCIMAVYHIAKVAARIFVKPKNFNQPPAWKRINHIVTLAFENRSFDNQLGRLYPKSAEFNGLSGNEENSYIDRAGVKHTIKVWDSQGVRMDTPNPDPGEEFREMNFQLFETDQPIPGAIPTMGGFAQNYYDFICHDKTAQKELRKKRGLPEIGLANLEPTEEEIRDIMHCYSPDQVPVITQLARTFGVSDMYHASAPNQTWPNRFFMHAGTANGYENNNPPHFPYTMKTVFTRFNELKRENGWKIYYNDLPQSAALSDLWPHCNQFKHFDTFLEDARSGKLPSYSFIEPRYYQEKEFPNDQHPPHDVRHGEQLMAQVYNALRQSPCWKETLLVITYDEHGGCYDHQPPPSAVPPEPPKEGQKFNFDRYGVRVPAVFVSPLIASNTILRPPKGSKAPVFDHASIIASVRYCFGLGGPLTERDAVAPDLSGVLNMPAGTYNMGPEEIVAAPAPQTIIQKVERVAMTSLQESLYCMAMHLPTDSSLEEKHDPDRDVDLLTGRRIALARFFNFVHKA